MLTDVYDKLQEKDNRIRKLEQAVRRIVNITDSPIDIATPNLDEAHLAPWQYPPIEVPVLELNYVCRLKMEEGKLVWAEEFTQWIIWDLYDPQDEEDDGIHVRCWLKHADPHLVTRDAKGWLLTWGGRPIRAKAYQVTWTSEDREVQDARLLPKVSRKPALPGWRR